MKLLLKINKTLDENAQEYFNKAKKLRKKISGAEKAINLSKEKILKQNNLDDSEVKKLQKIVKKSNLWFEKFHWFLTSNGFLVIAGRDANTNEDVIKKHSEKNDIVLHTDMAGSPFAVIKNNLENKSISDKDIEETADFIFAYSRAWKAGFGNADIFYVNPDQVTKTANQGEYLSKGAFMIRGKTNYVQNKINFCIGIYDDIKDASFKGKIFAGPEECAKKYCKKYFKLVPGKQKTSEIAKILKKELNSLNDLDEFIRVIPSSSNILLK